ncbi:hypothetical protein C8J57DRAFT_726393 [Mycena rebaudengoi]|nr:hypothetical protein C8J57DRAFT_726393 [Mycena rebaudengoi]
MSDEPNAKRRRTDDIEASEPPLIRSTEYWFDDGNIILQVEGTQFRIHKSILSLHSSAFLDMFTVPQPANDPTLEGCAIVVLSGDAVEDWTHLFNEIYSKGRDESPPSLGAIVASLRLGKKYDFAPFRKDAIRRLKYELPSTLEGWDQKNKFSWTKIEHTDAMEFPLIRVAREVGLVSILPALFYLALAEKSSLIHKGPLYNLVYNTTIEIDPIDRATCLQGHIKLLKWQDDETLWWLLLSEEDPLSEDSCDSPHECAAALLAIKNSIHAGWCPQLVVLSSWKDAWDHDLCVPCTEAAKDTFKQERIAAWRELPSMFGLPEWQELMASNFE